MSLASAERALRNGNWLVNDGFNGLTKREYITTAMMAALITQHTGEVTDEVIDHLTDTATMVALDLLEAMV